MTVNTAVRNNARICDRRDILSILTTFDKMGPLSGRPAGGTLRPHTDSESYNNSYFHQRQNTGANVRPGVRPPSLPRRWPWAHDQSVKEQSMMIVVTKTFRMRDEACVDAAGTVKLHRV